MKMKHATAKISTLTLSALVFALAWGWIAASRGQDDAAQEAQASAPAALGPVAAAPPPTPETVIRRIVVVRTRNADGTVTEQVVPETEYIPPTASKPQAPTQKQAPQPVARSRGS